MKKPLTIWLPLTLCVFLAFLFLPAGAKKWVVTVKNYSFTPYNLTHVRAHDTIQWVWENGIHTTTSTSIPAGADSWDYPINQDTTSFIYIPTDNGTFFYTSTPDTARNMVGQFTVTGGNGVVEISGKTGIFISPNPFHDKVCLHFGENHNSLTSVQIYNQAGKLIRSVAVDPISTAVNQTIEVKNLPRGLFIFNFKDDSRSISVQKGIHD